MILNHIRVPLAGMPSINLTEVAAARTNTISFFLVGFLVAAVLIRLVWNSLRQDWPNWPKLTYRGALALSLLWALLFVLVLTMISGTRELLTPGAWVKTGLTYRLAEPEGQRAAEPRDPRNADLDENEEVRMYKALLHEDPEQPATALEVERGVHLRALWAELYRVADHTHDRFPTDEQTDAIPDTAWQLPRRPASRYRYVGGSSLGPGDIVAYEPAIYGDQPFVLYVWGDVTRMPVAEINEQIRNQLAGRRSAPVEAVRPQPEQRP